MLPMLTCYCSNRENKLISAYSFEILSNESMPWTIGGINTNLINSMWLNLWLQNDLQDLWFMTRDMGISEILITKYESIWDLLWFYKEKQAWLVNYLLDQQLVYIKEWSVWAQQDSLIACLFPWLASTLTRNYA